MCMIRQSTKVQPTLPEITCTCPPCKVYSSSSGVSMTLKLLQCPPPAPSRIFTQLISQISPIPCGRVFTLFIQDSKYVFVREDASNHAQQTLQSVMYDQYRHKEIGKIYPKWEKPKYRNVSLFILLSSKSGQGKGSRFTATERKRELKNPHISWSLNSFISLLILQ